MFFWFFWLHFIQPISTLFTTKKRNALNLSPHFKLRQKKKSYNAPAKMQLKGKCISGFEVLLKPPKWKLIMFYSFSVLLLCKKTKKESELNCSFV